MIMVFIIESPAALDNLEGRNEREPLEEALRAIGLNVKSYNVREPDEFINAFVDITTQLKSMQGPVYPIVHISSHGTQEGIVLTNGMVFWSELAQLLAPLNAMCNDMLLVAMSMCYGYHAFEMASEGNRPYRCLIGPLKKPSWQATLVGYSVLYNLLAQRQITSINELINRMNNAVGVDNLFGAVIRTENIEKMLLTYQKLMNMDPKKLKTLMLQVIEKIKSQPAPHQLANAIE